MFRKPIALVLALTLLLGFPLAPAPAGAWYGGWVNTGCYQGTNDAHLWTYNAPMNGALIRFASGGVAWFPGFNFGGGSWGVPSGYLDGSRPVSYAMDWKYAGVSGWVTVYCFG